MNGTYEYRFSIDAFTPETIPMARLAEYMADLAMLLGEPERVHFERLEKGSAVLVQAIEKTAFPKVAERLRGVRTGDAPSDVLKAFQSLDRRLAVDNAVATLSGGEEGAEVIRFPGRERPKPLLYGSIRQQGSLDGKLIRIGGKDARATLEDGDQTWICEMTHEMAQELSSHLYKTPIRVFGEGRWRRDPEKGWDLEQFTVSHFEVLDPASWPETVARLRSIKGGEWLDSDDPLSDVKALRDGGEEPS